MPSYFPNGQSWASLNRSERTFCAGLYSHELLAPGSLAAAIAAHCKKPPQSREKWCWDNAAAATVPEASEWDVALEACFFREMYRAQPNLPKPKNFNALAQTTFDLALFSEDSIIVIEAKGIESFSTAQLRRIADVKADIQALMSKKVDIFFYGLISSRYLTNISGQIARGELHLLDGLLAWRDLAEFYGACPLLTHADAIYGSGPALIQQPR